MARPKITDDDNDTITATLGGNVIRSWEYGTEQERRAKMLMAREFVEGWHEAEKEVRGDWQPIETAPHGQGINTGPAVLVGGGVFWDEGERYQTHYALDRSAIGFHDPLKGWIIGKSETHGGSIVAEPTHWISLPEPPEASDEEGGEG